MNGRIQIVFVYFQVNSHISESLQYIQEDVDGNWTLVYEDGEMLVMYLELVFSVFTLICFEMRIELL